ncbi:hypothetical protein H8356DRAFT_1351017 [Neocallimastix lanati (nom. inval.)]|nr:hypothetical protein H8356DRAFT_1351017 [Neocallimastix sp. JGI-2020a]
MNNFFSIDEIIVFFILFLFYSYSSNKLCKLLIFVVDHLDDFNLVIAVILMAVDKSEDYYFINKEEVIHKKRTSLV